MTQPATTGQPLGQPLGLRAAAVTAAEKADREQQADRAKRRADNTERARAAAVRIARQRLGVATSTADWTPTGDPDNDRSRAATATIDGLGFLAVERYSPDIGYTTALYLRRPCPVTACDGQEQAEVSSLEALGWLLRASQDDPASGQDPDDGSHLFTCFTCRACEHRAAKQRQAEREAAAAAAAAAEPPPSAAEVLAEALRALIREETTAALDDHQAGWQHHGQGGV